MRLDKSVVIGFSYAVMNRTVATVGWILLGLALLFSFWLDFANTAQGGAIDLRNRITGVRLLEYDVDAFHYKWRLGDADIFCDVYNNPNMTVNKTTVTPTLLLVHAPEALLPYRLGQFSWFLFQWAMLVGTGWLWLRACTEPWQRWLVAAFVVGFTYTDAWRLHAERGQSYVVLTFFFAWWLRRTLDPKTSNGPFAGFLAGLLVALRPPFGLVLPFLALHRRGQLLGAAAGLLLGVGGPMLLHPATWVEYDRAMHTHAVEYIEGFHIDPGQREFPPRIEGVPTDIIGFFVKSIPFGQFSIHGLLLRLHVEPVGPGQDARASLVMFSAVLLVIVPFCVWLWWSRKLPFAYLAIGTAAWYFLADLFLPDYRGCYDDVFIINVVAAGIVTATRIPCGVWPCLLALPVGWAVYAFEFDRPWAINLPTALYTAGAILFLFWFNNRVVSSKVAPAC